MVHIIKCDEEILYIPGGFLPAVLSGWPFYINEKGEIDYKTLKDAIRRGRIPPEEFVPPAWASELGYLDFDRMEQERSREPIIVGNYGILLPDRFLKRFMPSQYQNLKKSPEAAGAQEG